MSEAVGDPEENTRAEQLRQCRCAPRKAVTAARMAVFASTALLALSAAAAPSSPSDSAAASDAPAAPADAASPAPAASDDKAPVPALPSRDVRYVLGNAVAEVCSTPRRLPVSVCLETTTERPDAGGAPLRQSVCHQLEGSGPLPPFPETDGAQAPHIVRLHAEFPPMADVRVRLMDESHRLVPSTDTQRTDALMTAVVVEPDAPLTPGTRYFLRIDGLVEERPAAFDGTAYDNTRVSFVTPGEKPAPEPKKFPAGSRKKGRRGKRR